MDSSNIYLACDFGGGSGRVMAGWLDANGEVQLEEIHRFRNRQVRLGRTLYWDFPALMQDMKDGLRMAGEKYGSRIQSIGIDTWGVDFGLVDTNGQLLGLPVCYRDERTSGLCQQYIDSHDAQAHYATAGIQMMDINTIYQLIAMQQEGSPLLQVAAHLLFIPDLFSYYLTGIATCEYTIASTSELLDARQRNWNWTLIDSLHLRREMFPPIVQPGTPRGRLTPEVAEELGLSQEVVVMAVGSHDTQSASHAARPFPSAFLSSGTWSLLGVATDEPLLTEEARLSGISNEGGVGGKVNVLQNITGLWFLQRLMAEWEERGEGTDFDTLLPAAEQARISSIVDVDDPIFSNPRSMEQTLAAYCRDHALEVPATQGEFTRVVLQSLAQRYARGIQHFNALLPHPIQEINIIGGGSRNALLNRLTAEATGLPVVAGPVEATAIGNILCQAQAMPVMP